MWDDHIRRAHVQRHEDIAYLTRRRVDNILKNHRVRVFNNCVYIYTCVCVCTNLQSNLTTLYTYVVSITCKRLYTWNVSFTVYKGRNMLINCLVFFFSVISILLCTSYIYRIICYGNITCIMCFYIQLWCRFRMNANDFSTIWCINCSSPTRVNRIMLIDSILFMQFIYLFFLSGNTV